MNEFVTIVAGSRSITDAEVVETAINDAPFEITELVSGGAEGVDTLAEDWADEQNVAVETFRPDYDTYDSNLAPLKRNEEMANYAEALVAVWNGDRPSGTTHMIQTAKDNDLALHIHRTDSSTLSDF